MDDLEERFQEIFRQVFDDEELVLTRETTASDVEGWDSLMHINLIIAIERELRLRFAVAEISRLKEEGQSVGTFLDLVRHKLQRV